MEIKNTTTMSKEIITATQKINFREKSLPFLVFFSVLFLVLAGISALSYDWNLCIGILAIMTIINFSFLLSYNISIKNLNKSDNRIKEAPIFSYLFSDNEIKIEVTSESLKSTTIFKYKLVSYVLVTKQTIILYQNKITGYIVDSKSFTSGTHQELINLLKQKIDTKKIKFSRY